MSKISAKEVTEIAELFSKEPLEIAADAEKRAKVIKYMRNVRENIAELEKAGKTITKKSAAKGIEQVIDKNVDPLDLLAG